MSQLPMYEVDIIEDGREVYIWRETHARARCYHYVPDKRIRQLWQCLEARRWFKHMPYDGTDGFNEKQLSFLPPDYFGKPGTDAYLSALEMMHSASVVEPPESDAP